MERRSGAVHCGELEPSSVVSVEVDEASKSARVIVPDTQLSLAIGKAGQNARLAAKLTGWKIDIKRRKPAHRRRKRFKLCAGGCL